jgi:hypothetical protein
MRSREPAVLFVRVPAVSPEFEAAYEGWYDADHVAHRMDKPHFVGAHRYDVLVGPQRYFVFYELSNVAALTTPEYLALREWEAAQPAGTFEAPGSSRPGFERGVYEQVSGAEFPSPDLDAPVVHIAGYNPPAAEDAAFAAWLDGEYGSAVRRVPGVVGVRHFTLTNRQLGPQAGLRTEKPRRIVVHHLASQDVADHPHFQRQQQVARSREDADDEPYLLVGRLASMAHAVNASATLLEISELPAKPRSLASRRPNDDAGP